MKPKLIEFFYSKSMKEIHVNNVSKLYIAFHCLLYFINTFVYYFLVTENISYTKYSKRIARNIGQYII
jgi:hypothetical protein